MSKYEVQSQWENEASSQHTSLVNKASVSTVTVSKKAIIIVVSITIVAISIMFSVYSFGRRIEGTWVRQSDDNSTLAGMTVEVRRNNGVLEGTIISMPAGAESFEVGQVKWFALKKTGFGTYQGKSLISKDDGTYYYGNSDSIFTVMSGGNTLTMTDMNSDVEKGNFQVWVKQK